MGRRDGIPEVQSGTSPADGDKKEKGDSGVDSRERQKLFKVIRTEVVKK